MATDRRAQLRQYRHLLNTPEGLMMMDDLFSSWMMPNPLDDVAQNMGFNIGLQQAYRQLEAWKNGEGLDNE